MTDLLSSCRNYDNYRQAYHRCSGFKIPILGVHLKDLISVNEAMSDYVEENKVNVQKLQALYSHINELIQLQQIPPRLDANKDLVHLLTVLHLSVQLYIYNIFKLLSSFITIHCVVLDTNTDANDRVTAFGLSVLVWVWWESMIYECVGDKLSVNESEFRLLYCCVICVHRCNRTWTTECPWRDNS